MTTEDNPQPALKKSSITGQIIMGTVLLSASAMLFLRPMLTRWVRRGEIAPEVLWVPAIIFFISMLLYCWTRVGASPQQSRKAAWLPFQVGFGLVLLLLVIPGQLQEYRTRKTPPPSTELGMKALYQSKDARIRALVLNAAVCGSASPQQLHDMLRLGLEDTDPMVQETSIQAVEKITGNQFDRKDTIDVVQQSLDGFLDAATTKGASEF
jgi:hypothetical protein